jgi:hypothetical protein
MPYTRFDNNSNIGSYISKNTHRGRAMIVCRNDYPSLSLLMWDLHTDTLDGEEALKIYETNWRYLNPHEVSAEEMAFI